MIHTPTPLVAKRVDATHAVVYDATGIIHAKSVGHEHAFEKMDKLCAIVNVHDDLVRALRVAWDTFGALASVIGSAEGKAAAAAISEALAKARE